MIHLMTDLITDPIRGTHQDDIFTVAVTDEVLEAAACAGTENVRALTAALCTVMADCSS